MLKTDLKAHYGTYAAAAKALGVSKAAVSNWPDLVPEYIAYKFQVITRGKLRVDPAVYVKASAQEHVA